MLSAETRAAQTLVTVSSKCRIADHSQRVHCTRRQAYECDAGLRRDATARSFREEFFSMPVSDGSDHTEESTPAESSGRGQRRQNSSDEEDTNTNTAREGGNKRQRTGEKGSPKLQID